MQPRLGDYVEAGALAAMHRAWADVSSPVPTLRTLRRWASRGLLGFIPSERDPLLQSSCFQLIHVTSVAAGCEQVRSLQAASLATSGAARAAHARSFRVSTGSVQNPTGTTFYLTVGR